MGFAGLEEVYANDVAPKLQENVGLHAFALIDESVREILGTRQTFWATGGLALAVWQLSGAVRTVGSTLDRIYRNEAEQPFRRRLLRSLALAAGVIACICAATAAAAIAPLVYGDPGVVLGVLLWLLRYGIAASLLVLAVGLVVRYAPSERRPTRWVTAGAVLVTVCWLAVSAGFGAYITTVASFGSVYGGFVTIVVLLGWVYASALAFVTGIATDAVLNERVSDP